MQEPQQMSSSTTGNHGLPAFSSNSEQVHDKKRADRDINTILKDSGLAGNPKEILKKYGFQRLSPWRSYAPWGLLFLIAVLIALIMGFHISKPDSRLPEALTAVAALSTILLAYSQWSEARHEASFEKYFDRQEIANRKMEREGEKEGQDAGWESLFNMLVFAELDNLEYVSEKYKLGYIKPELALRAVRHFYARCIDDYRGEKFLERAKQWVQVISYEETTRTIVGNVVPQAEKYLALEKTRRGN